MASLLLKNLSQEKSIAGGSAGVMIMATLDCPQLRTADSTGPRFAIRNRKTGNSGEHRRISNKHFFDHRKMTVLWRDRAANISETKNVRQEKKKLKRSRVLLFPGRPPV
jgi:hypothetical protein